MSPDKMKKIKTILILLCVLSAGFFLLSFTSRSPEQSAVVENNVKIENGKQIIEIQVSGGYQPQTSIAKSGLPTTIRFVTNGAFDCSSSVRIPSLGIARIMPQYGQTDIDIGTPMAGTLQGTCSMGMYRFQVQFQS